MEYILKCLKEILTNEIFISYLEIVIEAIFLYLVLKEFRMTKKNFEWQEEEDKRYKLELIIRELRIQWYKVVCQIIHTGKWLEQCKNECRFSKKELEEKENEYTTLLLSGRDCKFNEIIKDYKLNKDEIKFLKNIYDKYVSTAEQNNIEILIKRNNLNNKKPSDEDINAISSFLNNVRCAKQICEVYNFDYKMIDKLYLKFVFNNVYDQKTN